MSPEKCRICRGLGYVFRSSRAVAVDVRRNGVLKVAPRCTACGRGAFAFRKMSVLDWMPSV